MKKIFSFLSALTCFTVGFSQATNNELKGKKLTIGAKSITAITNDTLLASSSENKLPTENAVSKFVKNSVWVNAKWFGVKGDGIFNNTDSFQAAIDYVSSLGGGRVYVPGVDIAAGKYYRVTNPFYMRSNVILVGDGASSFIKNDRPSRTNFGDQFCLYMGNYSPRSFQITRKYAVTDITAGQSYVIVSPVSKVDSFTVGQLVLIESAAYKSGAGNYPRPFTAYINKVVSKNADTLFLDEAIQTSITNALVGDVGSFTNNSQAMDALYGAGTGRISYMVENAGLENMSFESVSGTWTARLGMYKCHWDKLHIRSTHGVGGNGFAFFRGTNMIVDYSIKGSEMAMYSHDSQLDNVTFNWWNGDTLDVDRGVIRFAENVRRNAYSNIKINGGIGGEADILFQGAFDNKVTNVQAHHANITVSAIDFRTSEDSTYNENNVISNSEFSLSAVPRYIRMINSIGGANTSLKNNKIDNCRFYGSSLVSGDAILFDGENNIVSNCYFDTGKAAIATGPGIVANNQFVNSYIKQNPYTKLSGLTQKGNTTTGGAVVSEWADTASTSIGRNSLILGSGTNAYRNSGFGARSAQSVTSGDDITAIGYNASGALTTALNVTAVGSQALANANANYATAVGSESQYNNTSGVNTSVGYRSLYNNITGGFNTAVGRESLLGTTGVSLGSSSAFGYRAGYTGGNNSVYMGREAGNLSAGAGNGFFGALSGINHITGNNVWNFGYNISAPAWNASELFNFGNALILRNTAAADSSASATVLAGIGVMSPSGVLELRAGSTAQGAIILNSQSLPTGTIAAGKVAVSFDGTDLWARIGTSNAKITNQSGASGITTIGAFNTTSTANGLDISGVNIALHAADGTNPGALTAAAQNVGGSKTFLNDILVTSGVNIASAAAPAGTIRAGAFRSGTGQNLNFTANATSNHIIFNLGASEMARIAATTGNLLIGTSTDGGFKLDVTGTGRFTSTLRIGAYTLPATDGSNGQVLVTNGSGSVAWGSSSAFSGTASRAVQTGTGGALEVSSVTTTELGNLSGTTFNLSEIRPKSVQALTDGATITMNLANGNHGKVTLGGNRTLAFSNLADGDEGWIIVTQDGTGSRTITLPANSTVPNGFGGGTSITLSTAAGAKDVLFFVVEGTNIHWSISQNQIGAGS